MSLPEVQITTSGGSRLVQDYRRADPAAVRFFAGHFGTLESYRNKLRETQSRFGAAERAIAASALRPTSEASAERLARFVEQGGAVVTTGQQAGLFTGPLYTIHKMLAAVGLARVLEAQLGVVVLPVFWVASEDHDWAEANHTWFFDRERHLRRLEVHSEEVRALPVSERTVGPSLESAFDEAAQAVGGAPFAADYLKLLRSAYTPTATVAGAFRRTIEAIGAPFDLLTTDAADPVIKRESRPVLEQAVLEWRRESENLRSTAEDLLEAGYHMQVALVDDSANVFIRTEAGRERLRRARNGWRTGSRRDIGDDAAILSLLADDPGILSPNALLRPVVESAAFPVLSYVAGPGEASYFAQIGGLFRAHGMEPPIVYPRPSILWSPTSAEQSLRDLGISRSDLAAPEHELGGRIARGTISEATGLALRSLRGATTGGFRELLATFEADAPLEQSLGSIRNRMLAQISQAESAILRHAKRSNSESLQRLTRIRNLLQPRGQPQERVLNVFPFLADYGPELLARTSEAIQEFIRAELA